MRQLHQIRTVPREELENDRSSAYKYLDLSHILDSGVKHVYHGTNATIDNFSLDFVGSENGTTGGGYGVYFTESYLEACTYGPNVYTCILNLKRPISNQEVTLSKEALMMLTRYMWDNDVENLLENYGLDTLDFQSSEAYNIYESIIESNKNDVEIVGDIINSGIGHKTVLEQLSKMGYTHTLDTETSIFDNTTHYIVYDMNCILEHSIKENDL